MWFQWQIYTNFHVSSIALTRVHISISGVIKNLCARLLQFCFDFSTHPMILESMAEITPLDCLWFNLTRHHFVFNFLGTELTARFIYTFHLLVLLEIRNLGYDWIWKDMKCGQVYRENSKAQVNMEVLHNFTLADRWSSSNLLFTICCFEDYLMNMLCLWWVKYSSK